MNTSNKPLGTYATLLADIETLASATLTARKEWASAARFMADKIIGTGIATPIDLEMLSKKLKDVSASTFGLKKSSFSNIKSRFRKACVATGRSVMPGRHTNDLTPEWLSVLMMVPTKRRARPVSRLAHFASAKGWLPQDIDDTKMATFKAELLAGLEPHASRVFCNTCKALNDFAAEVEGWPVPSVSMPVSKALKTLPWDDLPSHLTSAVDLIMVKKTTAKDGSTSLSDYGKRCPAPIERLIDAAGRSVHAVAWT